MCQVKATVQVAKTVSDEDVAGTAGFSSCDHIVIVGTKLLAGPHLFKDALFQVAQETACKRRVSLAAHGRGKVFVLGFSASAQSNHSHSPLHAA